MMLVATALIGGCKRPGDAASTTDPRPNIVLIMIDTLRADRLGAYGRHGNPSGAIDALAAEGVTFDHAVAPAPWTLPSIASLFVSVYPSVHQTNEYERGTDVVAQGPGEVRSLSESFATLAERLQQAGYTTAAFVGNPFIIRKHGFAQGFDHFDADFAARTIPGSIVNDAALNWLRDDYDGRRPFFLYLHYMDVHAPLTVSPEIIDPLLQLVEANPHRRKLSPQELNGARFFFRTSAALYDEQPRHVRLNQYAEYYQALYDGVVREQDRHIEALHEDLSASGLWDDAYVILTADHGEALGEHRLWTHGRSAHQSQLHIPLILRWPGVLPAGKRVAETSSLIDLMPTILDQLGLAPEPRAQGVSLLGRINEESEHTPVAFAEAVKKDPTQRAIIRDKWKLLVTGRAPEEQLFDILSDPAETRDLASQYPARRAKLKQMLEQQEQRNTSLARTVVAVQAPALTEEERKRLEALGYIDGNWADDPRGADSPRP